MEPMKQCPNCGKYVAADKTYCMNCGTTLGVKCPACSKVVPLHTKVCSCGHSFVKKTKKVRKGSTLLPKIKKHARLILLCVLALCAVIASVFAALPALNLEVVEMTKREPIMTVISASGFSLIGYFLGAHPAGIASLLNHSLFDEVVTPLQLLMYGEGLGWLILLVGLVLCLLLVLPNIKSLGRATSRRLIPLTAVTLGGGTVVLGTDIAIRSIMTACAKAAFAVPEGVAPAELTTTWSVGSVFPILAFAATLVLFGVHMSLHILALSQKEEEESALTLKAIVSIPFDALGRLMRATKKKKGSTAYGKSGADETEKSITLTSKFTVYLVLLGASLVFTQALLSKISHIFFWFMLLLPLPLLLYTLVAKQALTVSMLSDSATTEKNLPYTYEFRIDNHSPLAFPFIDAKVSIPQSNSVRCTDRSVRLSMAPLSSYHMKNTVSFRFRGTYDIGVRCFYVYDFFRMFRVRIPISNMTTVYVLPRRLSLDDTLAQAVSDSTVRTVKSPLVVDKLEVSDIRDYRMGDSLKSIHWKLSSKSETFVVKDYNTGTSNETVIFCDLAAHFPDEAPKGVPVAVALDSAEEKNEKAKPQDKAARKAAKEEAKAQRAALKKKALAKRYRRAETQDTHDMTDEALEARLEQRMAAAAHMDSAGANAPAHGVDQEEVLDPVKDVHELAEAVYYEDMNEYLADGVVELTVASVLAELRQGHEVTLIWFDRRAEAGVFAYPLRGVEEFEHIYHLFATAPLCDGDKKVCDLTAMVSDIQSAKQLFVISSLDQAMLSELTSLPGVSDAGSFGSAEVILYNPEERFRYPAERTAFLEGCRQQLSYSGLSLRVSGMIAVRREDGQGAEPSRQEKNGEGGVANEV